VLSAVLGGVSLLAWRWGAPLDAPADPDLAYVPRPEWYFRCLFELRRYFTGEWEFVATLVIPLAGLLFFVSLPLFEWLLPRGISFALRTLVIISAVGGWGWLTWASFNRDWSDPEYRASQIEASRVAARARDLADQRQIPSEGAAALLRHDPKTRGPVLFARHCASCHSYVGPQDTTLVAADTSAPNLRGFATVDWIERLLDPEILKTPAYFGRTKFAEGDMMSHMEGIFADANDAGELRAQLRLVALALATEAQLAESPADSLATATAVEDGRKLIGGKLGCTDCHRFHEKGELGSAPDLTDYGSRAWLAEMIANPQGERFYPDDHNDRMPAFAKHPHDPKQNLLSPTELELLIAWLRGEWYEPPTPSIE
jgi:ubiquinol-cytochrome c reductase cytochrome b subunit